MVAPTQQKTPFKDRKELLQDIARFVQRHQAFFRQNSKRMSDLFEMTVYNDVIRFYQRKGATVQATNLDAKKTFVYKLSPNALVQNFSFMAVTFTAPASGPASVIEVHHNLKVESAGEMHIYYTADVVVCPQGTPITQKQANGRRHSYLEAKNLITFLEAKHMNPFGEVIFGFTGLVLELMPDLVHGKITPGPGLGHLCPSVVFSGAGNVHTHRIIASVQRRYGYNVICGLFKTKSQIYSFRNLKERAV